MTGTPGRSARRSAASRNPAWFERALLAAGTVGRVPAWALLAALLAVTWLVVWSTGGTLGTSSHLLSLPIIAAALRFGLRGAVVTALVAGVLCGPLMPLDTVAGEPQDLRAWVTRTVVLVAVGAFVSFALRSRQRLDEAHLTQEVRETLARPVRGRAHDASLVGRIDGVMAARAFHPVYQPVYSLADGTLLQVEALTRFDSEPYRSPDQWFAAAALAGRGAELEIAAVAVAIEHSHTLPLGVALSVNASPHTLGDPRLLALLTSAGRRQMIVEVTEHSVVADYEGLLERVAALRALGVRIAVDDAGAGISSLRHIVQLAPDIIKLDMSLTQDVGASPLRRALAASIVEFADRTGAQLLVEGIETVEDLLAWTRIGAHAVQGYLVGSPADLPVASQLGDNLRGGPGLHLRHPRDTGAGAR
ncbi:EAL domain-containing protein [Actinotalea sp.]|uniref:EAL domain-containing protein n=1 Tax=Actinotalea sp. TaxID=1872145 RepID=UPI002CC25DC1|nr:EAL domain-containing protein [Actinotalea sp.]HQY34579.1 EAL domain-containing protein [Actinotalea sp.]HRA51598.1 EAL domain-containing protein [Actinotalea sp.]